MEVSPKIREENLVTPM